MVVVVVVVVRDGEQTESIVLSQCYFETAQTRPIIRTFTHALHLHLYGCKLVPMSCGTLYRHTLYTHTNVSELPEDCVRIA